MAQAPPLAAQRLVRWQEAAGITAALGLAFAFDQPIRDRVHDRASSFGDRLADAGNAVGDGLVVYPVLLAGTLGGMAFGAKGIAGVSRRALESTVLAGAGTVVLKAMIGRQRPYQSPNDSFRFRPFSVRDNAMPSGHTAVAFALAGSLAAETRDRWSDVAFFSLAGLTGFARAHYDKHWASDVVAGAAIGIFSARFIHRSGRSLAVGPGSVAVSLAF